MKEHYFDYAATTPVDSKVLEVMIPYFKEKYGNPSSIYNKGQEARLAIEDARERIAKIIGADSSEIIFTSCATESNNLAIMGTSLYQKFQNQEFKNKKLHIITSSIEHHSVLEPIKYLEKNFNFDVTYLPVSKTGIVDLQDVKKAITNFTVLVSIMYANNEIGTIEPIKEISEIIQREKLKRKKENNNLPIYFHTDTVQAIQYISLNVNHLGLDLLSITGHKFYAPKGIGALYIRRGTKFLPQQLGGGQEKHQRAGTENVPYIIGMAKALEIAVQNQKKEAGRLRKLRDKLIREILKKVPDTLLTGDKKNRLPHIASFIFKYIEGESLVLKLNLKGFYASTGSACTSDSLEPSHVITALGIKPQIAQGSLRISLGKYTTEKDINDLIKFLPKIVEELREMSSIKGDF